MLPAGPPKVTDRGLALLGLILALAVAAYGQHIIDDRGTLGSGWPLLDRFDANLTTIYQGEQSVAFAVPLLIIGAALFALSVRLLHRAEDVAERAEADTSEGQSSKAGRGGRRRRHRLRSWRSDGGHTSSSSSRSGTTVRRSGGCSG